MMEKFGSRKVKKTRGKHGIWREEEKVKKQVDDIANVDQRTVKSDIPDKSQPVDTSNTPDQKKIKKNTLTWDEIATSIRKIVTLTINKKTVKITNFNLMFSLLINSLPPTIFSKQFKNISIRKMSSEINRLAEDEKKEYIDNDKLCFTEEAVIDILNAFVLGFYQFYFNAEVVHFSNVSKMWFDEYISGLDKKIKELKLRIDKDKKMNDDSLLLISIALKRLLSRCSTDEELNGILEFFAWISDAVSNMRDEDNNFSSKLVDDRLKTVFPLFQDLFNELDKRRTWGEPFKFKEQQLLELDPMQILMALSIKSQAVARLKLANEKLKKRDRDLTQELHNLKKPKIDVLDSKIRKKLGIDDQQLSPISLLSSEWFVNWFSNAIETCDQEKENLLFMVLGFSEMKFMKWNYQRGESILDISYRMIKVIESSDIISNNIILGRIELHNLVVGLKIKKSLNTQVIVDFMKDVFSNHIAWFSYSVKIPYQLFDFSLIPEWENRVNYHPIIIDSMIQNHLKVLNKMLEDSDKTDFDLTSKVEKKSEV